MCSTGDGDGVVTERSVVGSTISVVIPCHNYGRFLSEAIASVRDQSRAPEEVIVVDDGSTDDTPDVLRQAERAGAEMRVVRHQHAQGISGAMASGVHATSGDLLVRLDADDRLSPTYLEDLALALDLSGADVAYTGVCMFGARTELRRPAPFSPRNLARENFVHASAMFRRHVWERSGGYRTDFDRLGLEDWEFWLHALEAGARFVAVDTCELEYRQHAGPSRNRLSHRQDLGAHLAVRRLHPTLVGWTDLAAWLAIATAKKAGRFGRRTPR